jgi:hypothetical protein
LLQVVQVRGYDLTIPRRRDLRAWPGYIKRVFACIPVVTIPLLIGALCMTFRHRHPSLSRLLETAEVERRKGHRESEEEEEIAPEVPWSKTGGCLLVLRRAAPWKKNGCEIAFCSAIC